VNDDFLTADELAELGLAAIGADVRISRHALLIGAERIAIGDLSRIDAFSVLSAGERLTIGRHAHISVHVAILGRGPVDIGDFASISARCTIFSSNDDYSGDTMTNPTVPDRYRGTVDAGVVVNAHVILGASTTVLAGVTLGESAAVGAMSLVKEDVAPFTIVAGVPARVIRERRRGHRALADRMQR
jgi:acetyltransferase-like isoleucine patch superfamily enzyme